MDGALTRFTIGQVARLEQAARRGDVGAMDTLAHLEAFQLRNDSQYYPLQVRDAAKDALVRLAMLGKRVFGRWALRQAEKDLADTNTTLLAHFVMAENGRLEDQRHVVGWLLQRSGQNYYVQRALQEIFTPPDSARSLLVPNIADRFVHFALFQTNHVNASLQVERMLHDPRGQEPLAGALARSVGRLHSLLDRVDCVSATLSVAATNIHHLANRGELLQAFFTQPEQKRASILSALGNPTDRQIEAARHWCRSAQGDLAPSLREEYTHRYQETSQEIG